jgi:DNA-binding IclR family transcriptional regulator
MEFEMARDRGTLERLVALLTYVARSEGPIHVSKMATALDLPQSTVHRLINQMAKLGLLRRSVGTRHYEIGIEAFRLGAALSQRVSVVVELAMPSLHRIVRASKESCALGLYSERDATMFFAAQVQSPQPIRYYVDLFKSESVLWGTAGRAVLAFLAPQMTKVLLEGDPISPSGLPAPKLKALQEELALVRRRGYAVSNRGERVANASGIASPIFSSRGRVIGCLTLATPSFRYSKRNESYLTMLMKQEAEKISYELSGSPPPFAGKANC